MSMRPFNYARMAETIPYEHADALQNGVDLRTSFIHHSWKVNNPQMGAHWAGATDRDYGSSRKLTDNLYRHKGDRLAIEGPGHTRENVTPRNILAEIEAGFRDSKTPSGPSQDTAESLESLRRARAISPVVYAAGYALMARSIRVQYADATKEELQAWEETYLNLSSLHKLSTTFAESELAWRAYNMVKKLGVMAYDMAQGATSERRSILQLIAGRSHMNGVVAILNAKNVSPFITSTVSRPARRRGRS